ncbi:MAG: ABC transporter permease [Oscillospiraceae bacterium]|nr:ABC transporter permease [Oscillospiraceae bacterium]
MSQIKNLVKTGYNYRYLLNQLVTKSIKLKYRRSYLGVVWSLIEPLLTMIVLSFVFSTLLGRGDKYFPIYVLSGRLMYSFFSAGTKGAMKSIRNNSAMIKKVYVPKYMYPLASCTSAYVIFIISLIDLFLVMIVMGMKITPYILLSVVPIVVAFFLAYGVGMIMATINVFFRDVEYLWDVAMMLVMYTCAIFYKIDTFVGRKSYIVFRLNPLYALIKCFRDCIYGNPMELSWILYAVAFSAVACVIGVSLFRKHQDKFVLYI